MLGWLIVRRRSSRPAVSLPAAGNTREALATAAPACGIRVLNDSANFRGRVSMQKVRVTLRTARMGWLTAASDANTRRAEDGKGQKKSAAARVRVATTTGKLVGAAVRAAIISSPASVRAHRAPKAYYARTRAGVSFP